MAVQSDPGAHPSLTSGSVTSPKQQLTPLPSRPFASDTNPDHGQVARVPASRRPLASGTWWNLRWGVS
ncbi:unnamed protein product, partial [Clonostachys chloroleuca]